MELLKKIRYGIEELRNDGVIRYCRERIYFNRIVVVAEKKISETVLREPPLKNGGLRIIELKNSIVNSDEYVFSDAFRYERARYYLDKMIGGYALVKDSTIVGDYWYYHADNINEEITKPARHLEWLDIKKLGDTSVYTFDIYVTPQERKNGISAAFQNNVVYMLGKKGFTNALGYCWLDNKPAIWNTCVINKWREVKRMKMSRILVYNSGKMCLKNYG